MNRRKQVFYCHGCGVGGDLIRLVELLHKLSFREAVVHLGGEMPVAGMMEATYRFYQAQLGSFSEARQYLARRGIHSQEIVERLRIGYAPGACLRRHLERLGYSLAQLQGYGLIDDRGRDRFWRCLIFPLEETGNLYGRALDDSGGVRHRFLPRPKGGLYGWRLACRFSSLILVEGLFDLASLWQAGVEHVVASLGAHLSVLQMGQLGDCMAQRVYVCLDADHTGNRATKRLVGQLRQAGIDARRVELPWGHDPNSFFAGGATAADFQQYLDRAQP